MFFSGGFVEWLAILILAENSYCVALVDAIIGVIMMGSTLKHFLTNDL